MVYYGTSIYILVGSCYALLFNSYFLKEGCIGICFFFIGDTDYFPPFTTGYSYFLVYFGSCSFSY